MIRLAIVEDREETLHNLKKIIDTAPDIKVVGAYTNAEDAIGGILLTRPEVVVMDIDLPKMSGIECMMRLRQERPEILFLMFTVFEEDDKIMEALKAGADGYIIKRDSVKKIMEGIRDVTQQGAPMSRSIAKKVLMSFRESATKPKDPFERLTVEENEILEKLANGRLYKHIAADLEISENAIKQRIRRIYQKLAVKNKAEAIRKYLDR